MSNPIFVSITLGAHTELVGKLWCNQRKGKESSSFEYTENWLKHPERFALEPALKLSKGTFHTQLNQSLFSAIGDSAPDRWGRILMRRASTNKKTLQEIDYLLGVNDEARQGALRFSFSENSPYLAEKSSNSIPPFLALSKLLLASERFLDDKETTEDLTFLLAPGSSLGGARPKASIKDQKGNLSIAKFTRKDDDYSTVKWEAVALSLAKKAGILTPEWQLEIISKKPVLIIKRFDRIKHTRIPFLSAMSMLGAEDHSQHSYLEIAYSLIQNGAQPNQDLAELWRRIVFNILISNTDDHLRNHGFLYEQKRGWHLSPIYDINPTPIEVKPRILSTSINFDNPNASLDVALSVIDTFRLSREKAHQIIQEVVLAVSQWKQEAKRLGIPKQEITRMASAFEHEDFKQAKQLSSL